jgi:hypothetical protein
VPAHGAPAADAPEIDGPEPAADDAPALTTPETTAMPPITTTAMDAAIEVPQSVIDSATVAVPDTIQPAAGPADTDPADTDPADTDPADADLVDTGLVDGATEGDPSDDERPVEFATDPALAPTVEAEGVNDAEALSTALPSELADDPDQPVIIGETEELTVGLPIPEELIEEVAAAVDGPAVLPDYDRMTLAQVRGHLRELSSADVSELLRYEQDGDNRAPFLTLLSNRLVTLDAQHS